ncbi:hypothetical protein JCM6882_002909 [Rhodosporidiobolus microsporus]
MGTLSSAHYSWVHSVKTERTNDPSLLCTTTLPGHHAAALEGLCEICSFLSVRFPLLFKVERASYDADKPETHGDSVVGKESGAIIAVETCITGEKFDFRQIEEEEGPEWNPMRVAGLLLEDGVIVLVEDEQGQYRFQASSMCTSGFWRLKDKIGMTLDEIHFSGAVPNYAEKYQKAINKFFAGMKEEKFFERNNYFFQVDEKLGWSEATNGTEEVFDHTDKKPREEQFKPEGGHTQPRAATDINQIHFRTERQSMRRLPKSRAILFTTRSYLFPVTDLADEPGIPGRMASSVRSWPSEGNRNVDWYKASDLFAPVLLPYLDKKHAKQVASGVVQLNEKGETERTIRVERRLWKATVPFSKVARSRSWLLSSLSRSARLLQT